MGGDTCLLHVQVATQRVKGACKADIPLMDTDVKKLNGIGTQTAIKMGDIADAAEKASVDLPKLLDEAGIVLPSNKIGSGGPPPFPEEGVQLQVGLSSSPAAVAFDDCTGYAIFGVCR